LTEKIDATLDQLLKSKEDQYGMDFRKIQIGDSSLLSNYDRCFQLCNRLHYYKLSTDIPINLEAIPEKINTSFKLSIVPELKNENLIFLNEIDRMENLFARINKFYRDNISTELIKLNIVYV